MSDQDEEFQQRWGFRRNESDVDSSSDDRSGPSSPSEPKLKKHKLIFSEENNQETIDIESDPEAEVNPSSEEPNKEPTQSCKEQNKKPKYKGTPRKRKPRSRKPKKKAPDTPLNDLRGYTESLIEGIKVAREDLLKWMSKEMGNPNIQDDSNSSKPNNVKEKVQKKNTRSKSAKNSPNKGRRKSGAKAQKQDDGSSEKSAKGVSHPNQEETAVVPSKEPKNVPNSTTKVASTEKEKRKRSGPSVNKPKVADDQLTSKSAVVALPAPAPNPTTTSYLTLPSVVPGPRVENTERNLVANGDERDFGKTNAVNMGINLNSCFLRAQTQDGVLAQNGFRNVNDYEQNAGLKIGNGNGNGRGFPRAHANNGGFAQNGLRNVNYEQNTGIAIGNARVNGNANGNGSGNGFPFSLHPHPQGLNGGTGIQNPNQFGMQFLSQENRMSGLRMNGGPTRLPNGNHGFLESYGALNQHLRFKTQGGPLGIQFPDIRGTNFPPR